MSEGRLRPTEMWQPDGTGSIARIGVLTPHLDPVPESELYTIAPAGVSVHASRVPLGIVGPDGKLIPKIGPDVAADFARSEALLDAAALLAPVSPDAIVFGFTSSSYILGADADADLQRRLEECTDGIPAIIQSRAFVAALRALGEERIALFHPPWFAPALHSLGVQYFENEGFDIVYDGQAELRAEFGEIAPQELFDWVRPRVPDQAKVVLLAGGGMRAIGAIQALEDSLDRPVLSANQSAFWAALRAAKADVKVAGYGGIFAS